MTGYNISRPTRYEYNKHRRVEYKSCIQFITQSYAVCNTVPVRLTANAKLLLVLIISNHSHNHNYNEKQYKTMRAEQSRA